MMTGQPESVDAEGYTACGTYTVYDENGTERCNGCWAEIWR
jgi:hypothetical protein